MSSTVFMCDLAALDDIQRRRHHDLMRHLGAAVEVCEVLLDGYRFSFTLDTSAHAVDEWADLERRCCPFFELAIESEPLAVVVRGPDGVHEFIEMEFSRWISG